MPGTFPLKRAHKALLPYITDNIRSHAVRRDRRQIAEMFKEKYIY